MNEEIVSYWDERAVSYSNGVNDELGDGRSEIWGRVLAEHSREARKNAADAGRPVRAADLGCGPGFFSSLLAADGCLVDAVDSSAEMLAHARRNVSSQGGGSNVSYTQSDLLDLPFEDDSFDLVVSRNVMWLMRDPDRAYAEWLRVLRPGGTMLVFDANWYRYLVDDAIDRARHDDQDGRTVEEWRVEAQATTDQERRCEGIAARLPLTPVLRPAWDVDTLAQLGASSVEADGDIWQRVWTDGEKSFYRTSPLFLVKSSKPKTA